MKKTTKRLGVNREHLRNLVLQPADLAGVAGGASVPTTCTTKAVACWPDPP